MAKQKKLNSMRLLEANAIPYEVLVYDTSTRDAEAVAELIGAPEYMVYKTLIVEPVKSNDKPLIVMLASDRQLDLKKMAKAARQKKVQLATHADAERMTGLQVGGISALMLMDKNWDVYVDSPATTLQNIIISAGERGYQVRLAVSPLLNLLNAKIADLSTESD
jgi:Cys-tRNA(Pro)/Cys-tRNA(Cys) deacylase